MLRDLLNFKKALGSRAVGGEVCFEWLVTSAGAQTVGTMHRRAHTHRHRAGTAGPLPLTGPKYVQPGPRRGSCGFETTADVGSCSKGPQRRSREWPRKQLVPKRWASGRTPLCGHQQRGKGGLGSARLPLHAHSLGSDCFFFMDGDSQGVTCPGAHRRC